MLLAVALGGCSSLDAGPEVERSGAETTNLGRDTARPTPSASVGAMDDAAICRAFGDVITIIDNADLGARDGRMELQEQQGWYGVATRVLGRLPSGGDGAVQSAVADLQLVAPAVSPGSGYGAVGIGSAGWTSAMGDLGPACDDVGVPLTISVFTGG